MLFAAGFGTRMGTLTKTMPKPLIPVAGKPLIDHALTLLEGHKFDHVVINTHYLSNQIEAHVASRNVAISHETPQVLETGGGLRNALPLLGEGPVITMNTDAVWRGPNPIDAVLQAWDPTRMDALLLGIAPDRAVGHSGKGDFLIDANGRLTRGPGVVYSGIQIIKTDGLTAIPDATFSLNVLWNKMQENGRLFGVEYSGSWADVGHPAGIQLAEDMLEN